MQFSSGYGIDASKVVATQNGLTQGNEAEYNQRLGFAVAIDGRFYRKQGLAHGSDLADLPGCRNGLVGRMVGGMAWRCVGIAGGIDQRNGWNCLRGHGFPVQVQIRRGDA